MKPNHKDKSLDNTPWHKGLIAVLEPRLMFDGAMGETATEAAMANQGPAAPPQGNTLLDALDAPGGKDIAVIDTTIPDHEKLVEAAGDAGLDILLISGNSNGLQELARSLQGRQDISSLHILSHGRPGQITLGKDILSSQTLGDHAEALGLLRSSLGQDADILLYGCRVGETGDGLGFIQNLALETGADVAASDDLTGPSHLGGDWDLEIHTGSIESQPVFTEKTLSDFSHILPTAITFGFDRTTATTIGAKSGAAGINAQFTQSGYTLTVYGSSVSTYSDSQHNAVLTGSGKNSQTETEVTFSLNGNPSFDATSISIYNYASASEDFVITPSSGSAVNLTVAAYSTATATLNFSSITSFAVTNSDGNFTARFDDLSLAVLSANAAPTLSNAPGSITVVEDTASNVDLSAITLADADGDSLTMTLSVDTGTFSAPADGSGLGSGVTETLVNATTITLSGSAADINTYLDTAGNIQYQGPSDVNGSKTASLTLSVSDGSTGLASDPAIDIDITAVNDSPAASGIPSDITVTEDTASNVDLSAMTLTDVDSTDPDFTLTLTAGSGTLSASTGGGVTISGSGTSTLTLTGTVSNIDTFLNMASNVQYTGTTNTNGNNADTLTLTANDQDGSGNVTLATVNVDITAVNDNPVNSGSLPSDLSFTEDTAGNVDLSPLTLGDVDTTGNVVLTLAAGAGTLSASSSGGVTIGGSGSGTLTLTGTISDIDTYVNTASNIQYTGAAHANGDNADTLTVTINDQEGSGNLTLGTVNMDITAVNDSPGASGIPSAVTVTEDTASDVDLSAMALSDVDSTDPDFTLTITAGSGTLSASTGGGVTVSGSGTSALTLTGTVSNIDTFLDTASNVQYTGTTNTNGNNADTLTLVANDQDGSGNVTLATVNVDITAVNDNPTASGIPSDITVTEDTASNVDLSAMTLTDVDSTDPDFTLTITAGSGTLSASTGGGVTISGSGTSTLTLTGTVSNIDTFLNTASNVQYTGTTNTNGNNADTLTLTANDQDGSGNVTLATVNVDITAVNDNPVNSGSLPSDLSFTEDTAGNVDLSPLTLGDVDTTGNVVLTLAAGAGTLSASSSGGVTIGGSGSGTLTLTGTISDIDTYVNTASNIQYTGAAHANGDNADTLTVTINDQEGSGNLTLGTVNMDITAVNNNPTASGIPSDITVTEDTASNVDLSAMTLTDVDSTDPDFTLTITAGSGTLSASTGGGVTVSGSGTSTLNLTGTVSNIDTFLNTASNVQYTGTTNTNGNNADTLTLTANDQDGSGNVTLATVNVDITAVNDNPTASGIPSDITVTEDTASNVDLSAMTLTDVDSTDPDFTLTITAGSGTLSASTGGGVTISGSGTSALTLTGTVSNIDTFLNTASNVQYTGTTNTNGNNADTLTLTANDQDGSGNVTLATVNVDITAVNDNPVNSGSLPSDLSFTEDTAGNVDLSPLTLGDVDTTGNVVLTLAAGAGTLSASSSGGVTIGGSGSGTLTLTGTISDIDTYVNTASNIQYTGAAHANGDNADTLTVTINDQEGSGNLTLGTVNMDITAVNDSPGASGIPSAVTVTEDTASDVDLSAMALSDVDSTDPDFTLTITAGSGTLSASTGGGVTVSGSGTSALTLTGTVSNIDTFLNTASNVQYTGTTNTNGNNADTLTLVANDQDGSGPVSLGTLDIDITNANDVPKGQDATLNQTVDTVYSFKEADFGFTDIDPNDSLFRIQVATLNITMGSLTFNGVPVAAGDWIPAASLGQLQYKPQAEGTDNFTFKVQDNSSAANDTDTGTATLTLLNKADAGYSPTHIYKPDPVVQPTAEAPKPPPQEPALPDAGPLTNTDGKTGAPPQTDAPADAAPSVEASPDAGDTATGGDAAQGPITTRETVEVDAQGNVKFSNENIGRETAGLKISSMEIDARSNVLTLVIQDNTGGPATDVSITLSDGAPLPNWLSFDPASGSITGSPPLGTEAVSIRIISTNEQGETVVLEVEIKFNAEDQNATGQGETNAHNSGTGLQPLDIQVQQVHMVSPGYGDTLVAVLG